MLADNRELGALTEHSLSWENMGGQLGENPRQFQKLVAFLVVISVPLWYFT